MLEMLGPMDNIWLGVIQPKKQFFWLSVRAAVPWEWDIRLVPCGCSQHCT